MARPRPIVQIYSNSTIIATQSIRPPHTLYTKIYSTKIVRLLTRATTTAITISFFLCRVMKFNAESAFRFTLRVIFALASRKMKYLERRILATFFQPIINQNELPHLYQKTDDVDNSSTPSSRLFYFLYFIFYESISSAATNSIHTLQIILYNMETDALAPLRRWTCIVVSSTSALRDFYLLYNCFIYSRCIKIK